MSLILIISVFFSFHNKWLSNAKRLLRQFPYSLRPQAMAYSGMLSLKMLRNKPDFPVGFSVSWKRMNTGNRLLRLGGNTCDFQWEENEESVGNRRRLREYLDVKEAAGETRFVWDVVRQMVFQQEVSFGAGTEDGGPGVEEEAHVHMQPLEFLLCVFLLESRDYLPLLRMCLIWMAIGIALKKAVTKVLGSTKILKWMLGL
nr:Phenylalanine N-monooxygenase [Ipomoea batatas]